MILFRSGRWSVTSLRQYIKILSICFTVYSLFPHLTIGQLAGRVKEGSSLIVLSGLIDANGERSLRIPDSGTQFFTATIYIPPTGETTKHE
jgi:hypothetical protein